uniref:Uncharacterized protein n=1 Tax=Acrobeloides nanus TaxID=290746 RepID=A0A914DF24_9BILA
MNTPRRALGDVRNQVLVTPIKSSLLNKEPLKTPSSGKELLQNPVISTSHPNFLSFDGDNFEVYSEEHKSEAVTQEAEDEGKNDYEPIETFDIRSESPDHFEDLMEHFHELEKVVLMEDYPCAGDPHELYYISDFDEDFDLDKITIVEEL